MFILLTQINHELVSQIDSLKGDVAHLTTSTTATQKEHLKLEKEKNDLRSKLLERDKKIVKLEKDLDKKNKEKEEDKKKHDCYFKQVNELRSKIEERDRTISVYQRYFDDQNGEMSLGVSTSLQY